MNTKPEVRVDRLSRLMDERGWGPGELATYSGVSYDTIYKISGNKRPRTSAEILAKLAIALRCSVDYLVGVTDSPVPYTNHAMSEYMAALLANIADLSPRRRQELYEIVDALRRMDQADQEKNRVRLSAAQKMLSYLQEHDPDGLRLFLEFIRDDFGPPLDNLLPGTSDDSPEDEGEE